MRLAGHSDVPGPAPPSGALSSSTPRPTRFPVPDGPARATWHLVETDTRQGCSPFSSHANKIFPISPCSLPLTHHWPDVGHVTIPGPGSIMIGSAIGQSGCVLPRAGQSCLHQRGARSPPGDLGPLSREDGEAWRPGGAPQQPPRGSLTCHIGGGHPGPLSPAHSLPFPAPVPVAGSALCIPSHFRAALWRGPHGGKLGLTPAAMAMSHPENGASSPRQSLS